MALKKLGKWLFDYRHFLMWEAVWGKKQKQVNKDKTVKCHNRNANMDIQLKSLILLVVNIEPKTHTL